MGIDAVDRRFAPKPTAKIEPECIICGKTDGTRAIPRQYGGGVFGSWNALLCHQHTYSTIPDGLVPPPPKRGDPITDTSDFHEIPF